MKKTILCLMAALCLTPLSTHAFDLGDEPIARGYRGFADLGYTLGTGNAGTPRVTFATSHGYQLLPQLFVGAGVGLNRYYDIGRWGVPVFAHVRSDIFNRRFTPFVEAKVGYSFGDVEGFYLNPAIGYRLGFGESFALNVAMGYSFQYVEGGTYHYDNNGGMTFHSHKVNMGGIDLRLGIEF